MFAQPMHQCRRIATPSVAHRHCRSRARRRARGRGHDRLQDRDAPGDSTDDAGLLQEVAPGRGGAGRLRGGRNRLGRSRRGGLSRPLGPPVEPSTHAVPPRVESGPPENRGSGVGMASRPTGKTPVGAQRGRIAWSGARGAERLAGSQLSMRRSSRSGNDRRRTCCCSDRRRRCRRRCPSGWCRMWCCRCSPQWSGSSRRAGSRSTARRCTCPTGTGCWPCRSSRATEARQTPPRQLPLWHWAEEVQGGGVAIRDLAGAAEAQQPRGARGPRGHRRSPAGTRRCTAVARWQPPRGRAPTAAAGWSTRRHRPRHRGGAGHDEKSPAHSAQG